MDMNGLIMIKNKGDDDGGGGHNGEIVVDEDESPPKVRIAKDVITTKDRQEAFKCFVKTLPRLCSPSMCQSLGLSVNTNGYCDGEKYEIRKKQHIDVEDEEIFREGEHMDSEGFNWSIDQIALLNPNDLSYDVDFNQAMTKFYDETLEKENEEFFNQHEILPSPIRIPDSSSPPHPSLLDSSQSQSIGLNDLFSPQRNCDGNRSQNVESLEAETSRLPTSPKNNNNNNGFLADIPSSPFMPSLSPRGILGHSSFVSLVPKSTSSPFNGSPILRHHIDPHQPLRTPNEMALGSDAFVTPGSMDFPVLCSSDIRGLRDPNPCKNNPDCSDTQNHDQSFAIYSNPVWSVEPIFSDSPSIRPRFEYTPCTPPPSQSPSAQTVSSSSIVLTPNSFPKSRTLNKKKLFCDNN
ncbi:uncharacterized protein LOC141849394 [Brevipalpus obovatus]|uniref:uncharacterized protein LOC141849394 n=1 Tax=Brevipalpus obovatus TaxID=246614 RepID=UPI003D9F8877